MMQANKEINRRFFMGLSLLLAGVLGYWLLRTPVRLHQILGLDPVSAGTLPAFIHNTWPTWICVWAFALWWSAIWPRCHKSAALVWAPVLAGLEGLQWLLPRLGTGDWADVLAALAAGVLLLLWPHKPVRTGAPVWKKAIASIMVITTCWFSLVATSKCGGSDGWTCEPSHVTANPVYLSYEALRQPLQPDPVRRPRSFGKILVWNNYLLANEPQKGIQIYDNSNPANPLALSYLPIPGNIDLAVKNGFLYADSFVDLLIVDIRDMKHIRQANRLLDVFAYNAYQAIPEDVYLSEVNPEKGVVVDYVPIN